MMVATASLVLGFGLGWLYVSKVLVRPCEEAFFSCILGEADTLLMALKRLRAERISDAIAVLEQSLSANQTILADRNHPDPMKNESLQMLDRIRKYHGSGTNSVN